MIAFLYTVCITELQLNEILCRMWKVDLYFLTQVPTMKHSSSSKIGCFRLNSDFNLPSWDQDDEAAHYIITTLLKQELYKS